MLIKMKRGKNRPIINVKIRDDVFYKIPKR